MTREDTSLSFVFTKLNKNDSKYNNISTILFVRIMQLAILSIYRLKIPKVTYYRFRTLDGVCICKSDSLLGIFAPRSLSLGIGPRKYFRVVYDDFWEFTNLSEETFSIEELNERTQPRNRIGFLA